MTAIRFALISLMFLWGGNTYAQKSSASTTTLEIKDFGSSTHVLSRLYLPENDNDFRQWERFIDTFRTTTKTVEDLSPYVNESYFDSIIENYNSSNFEAMLFTNVDSIEPERRKTKEDFYKLFKKAYGTIQNKSAVKREIITTEFSRYAIITYAGIFKAMQGQFSIRLNVTEKEQPYFVDMFCKPYDYSNISLFSNISGLTLEYIRAKNITTLMREASGSIQKRIVSKKKLERGLEVINCDSLKQFTSNLVLQGNSTYARVVYDMLNDDKYLALVFVNEDKKFILYDLGFIDKKKD